MDVGVGVVIGSSLINVLFLMGLVVVFSFVFILGNVIIRDGVVFFLVVGVLIWSSLNDGDVFSVCDGGFLFGGLVVYIYVLFFMEWGGDGDLSGGGDGFFVSFVLGILFIGLGGVVLFFGVEYFINVLVEVGCVWFGGSNVVFGFIVLVFGIVMFELVVIIVVGFRC